MSQHSSPTLRKGITLVPAVALIVTNVIGSGIFFKTRVMVCNVGSPLMVLVAWVAAGLLTLTGALSFAELSTLMPRSGGQYNFISTAFGRLWGFLYGWMETLLDGAASIAAIGVVVVIFGQDLFGAVLRPGQIELATAALIGLVSILNLTSVRANGWVATLITVLKVALIAGIAIAPLLWGDSISHLTDIARNGRCEGVPESARHGLAGFGAAMVGALWAYNGWSDLSMVAEEVRDPARVLPQAIIGSSLLVILLYVGVNASYFLVLDAGQIANLPESAAVATAVMIKLFGPVAAAVLTAGMLVTNFGALHSTFLSVSRIPFAMARDGLLPAGLATVSPRSRVPSRAIMALGAIAIGFACVGGFDLLTDIIVFMLLVFNGMSVAALYVLRRRLPDAPRPYRVLGYPLVPAVFLLSTVFLVANTVLATPGRVLASVLIVATGVPVYFWFARRSGATASQDGIAAS
jgi:basic amino acid/polyamine antiporter, APA family